MFVGKKGVEVDYKVDEIIDCLGWFVMLGFVDLYIYFVFGGFWEKEMNFKF